MHNIGNRYLRYYYRGSNVPCVCVGGGGGEKTTCDNPPGFSPGHKGGKISGPFPS